jgi:membrane dipeptidase
VIQVNFYSGFLDNNYFEKKKAFLAKHSAESEAMLAEGKTDDQVEQYIYATYPQEADALRAPFSAVIDHIDYIVQLVGIDYVGIGSDFDGIESPPVGLDDVTYYPAITKALLDKGYSKKDIKKILGGNFLRVLKANEKK